MEVISTPGGQLIYKPEHAFPLLFRPTSGVPAIEAVEDLFDAMSELKEKLAEDWRDDWVFPIWQ